MTQEDIKREGKQVPSTWIAEYEELVEAVAKKTGVQVKCEHPGAFLTLEVVCGAGGTYSVAPIIEKVYKIIIGSEQKQSHKIAFQLTRHVAKIIEANKNLYLERRRIRKILADKHQTEINNVKISLPIKLSKWPGEHVAIVDDKEFKFNILLDEDGIIIKE